MYERLVDSLPNWLHPRFPLIANQLRAYRAMDIRIAQSTTRFIHIFWALILLLFLALVSAIIFRQGLSGFLLFPVTLVVVPSMLLLSELLLLRSLITVPGLSAQLVAGEIEHGTWEPLLSTPLPRHEIILSKFSAILWNSEHIILPLLLARILITSFITTEAITLNSDRVNIGTPEVVALIGILIITLPMLEIAFISALGLLLSFWATSARQANGYAWGAWLIFRTGAAVLMVSQSFVFQLEFLPILAGNALAPHTGIIYGWLFAERQISLAAYASLHGFVYGVIPLLSIIISLALLLHMVQYQSVQLRRFRPKTSK